jgi:hypothetical protein
MAARKPSGPTPVKRFTFALECDPDPSPEAGLISDALYKAILRKSGRSSASLLQGRIVLSVEIYKPEGKGKAGVRSKTPARKTPTSRGE